MQSVQEHMAASVGLTKGDREPVLASADAVTAAGGPNALASGLHASARGQVAIRGRDQGLNVFGVSLADM